MQKHKICILKKELQSLYRSISLKRKFILFIWLLPLNSCRKIKNISHIFSTIYAKSTVLKRETTRFSMNLLLLTFSIRDCCMTDLFIYYIIITLIHHDYCYIDNPFLKQRYNYRPPRLLCNELGSGCSWFRLLTSFIYIFQNIY